MSFFKSITSIVKATTSVLTAQVEKEFKVSEKLADTKKYVADSTVTIRAKAANVLNDFAKGIEPQPEVVDGKSKSTDKNTVDAEVIEVKLGDQK